ncbi:Apolipoprotein N-acyltransferase [Methylobrevis pamukkalensis]|uniref:Apolipoprotein N-acyltransferase n=1 Tax=Methylobrevis pamukkalensis TaxID=1439726 RepID=A0A1E3H733_9HYPH|nr:Apolipoprotein N-acyltransferase [Methylobrevis pamukkalensis]
MLALAGLLVVGNLGYGAWRLAGADAGTVEGIRLRIVQPAIDQSEKWTPEARRAALATYLDLSDSRRSPEDLGILGATHLVWPETALPFFLTESPEALSAIADALPPGTTLITGAPRVDGSGGERRYFNSVYAVDDGGRIVAAYDKAHLVPFGEYLPFAPLMERIGLRQIVQSVGGFSEGPGRGVVSLPGTPPFGVLICYEIIFPDAAIDRARRPDWIVNVTNDGWFGHTSGPYQHLAEARLRAIEEGLPVVRAANTGVSAIIDAHGRITASVGLGETGVVDGGLPVALPPTVYARHGRLLLGGLLFTTFTLAAVFRARSRRAVDNG